MIKWSAQNLACYKWQCHKKNVNDGAALGQFVGKCMGEKSVLLYWTVKQCFHPPDGTAHRERGTTVCTLSILEQLISTIEQLIFKSICIVYMKY